MELTELSGAQQVRLAVLDLVRRAAVGEDVPVEDLVAMAAWVIDGDHRPAREIQDAVHRRYAEHAEVADEFRPGRKHVER